LAFPLKLRKECAIAPVHANLPLKMGRKTLPLANFHAILGEHYSFATGGSNVNEHWSSPDQLGDSVATTFNDKGEPQNSNGFHTEETCSQYNTLKMLRHLFRWQP
jgi:DUF1680 family protein